MYRKTEDMTTYESKSRYVVHICKQSMYLFLFRYKRAFFTCMELLASIWQWLVFTYSLKFCPIFYRYWYRSCLPLIICFGWWHFFLSKINVGFIPFFVFWSVTKKQKNQLSFSVKMRIFYPENKQTGQLIFSFLVTLTKKRKMEWTRQKWSLPNTNY